MSCPKIRALWALKFPLLDVYVRKKLILLQFSALWADQFSTVANRTTHVSRAVHLEKRLGDLPLIENPQARLPVY